MPSIHLDGAGLAIDLVPVTPFQQNCSIVRCTETGRGCFVDPGGEVERLLDEARRVNVEIESILITHAHLDHAGAVAELVERFGWPVYGPHRDEAFWIEGLPMQAAMFGIADAPAPFVPTRWLDEGALVEVGAQTFLVQHCPGHTPGHVTFFHAPSSLCFVGDVLFAGSIGRTDFPKGDLKTLVHSIRERLFPLGDEVRFIPGHGPTSTFGEQRRTNPFVSDDAVAG